MLDIGARSSDLLDGRGKVQENNRQVDFARLVEWVDGRLPEDEARTVEEALVGADSATLADVAWLRRFREAAERHGMEVALDIAIQASPDHPWVTEHPEWFTTRPDGSIAYAENPPKKYQDIYPINFDNDPEGIYAEVLRIVKLWIDHGVTVFRVDNPHTKPVPFWEWMIREVLDRHPDVIFLAEAFTKPKMMRQLAKVGYVAQNAHQQIFCDSVAKEVGFAPTVLRRPAAEVESAVRSTLDAMGLAWAADRHPMSLSRGDRLRVVITGSIADTAALLALITAFQQD